MADDDGYRGELFQSSTVVVYRPKDGVESDPQCIQSRVVDRRVVFDDLEEQRYCRTMREPHPQKHRLAQPKSDRDRGLNTFLLAKPANDYPQPAARTKVTSHVTCAHDIQIQPRRLTE